MDPQQLFVKHMMKKLSPGLSKWDPELATDIYSEYFLSDDSDDSEDPDHKGIRDGWKNGPKKITKRACFRSITV